MRNCDNKSLRIFIGGKPLEDNFVSNHGECGYKSGKMPSCVPLALAYVPMQQSSVPEYETDTAIIRGTLFSRS